MSYYQLHAVTMITLSFSSFSLSLSHTHTLSHTYSQSYHTHSRTHSMQAPSVPRHYVAIAEYTPSNDDQGLPLKMNQEVEVLGLNQYTGWWLVRIQDYRTGEPATGWVPASYLRTAKDQTNMPL